MRCMLFGHEDEVMRWMEARCYVVLCTHCGNMNSYVSDRYLKEYPEVAVRLGIAD